MRKRPPVLVGVWALTALTACVAALWSQDDALRPPLPKEAPARQVPFPDFGWLPPQDQYDGPLFSLSQDYPAKKVEAEKLDFLEIPFNENDKDQNWLKYLLAVRSHCFEGNMEVDWDVRKNAVRKWYHAPWQHWGGKRKPRRT